MNQVEAVAVLLVMCGLADGELELKELKESEVCLVESQGCSSDVAKAAILSAGAGLKVSTKDALTNAVTVLMQCNQGAKENVITALSRVAVSDANIDEGEGNFVMMIAKLLGAGPFAS